MKGHVLVSWRFCVCVDLEIAGGDMCSNIKERTVVRVCQGIPVRRLGRGRAQAIPRRMTNGRGARQAI